MNDNRLWSYDIKLCTNGVKVRKNWVLSHTFQFTQIHGVAAMQGLTIPRLRDPTLQISKLVRNVRHWISGGAPTVHWKCVTRMQNSQTKFQPAL